MRSVSKRSSTFVPIGQGPPSTGFPGRGPRQSAVFARPGMPELEAVSFRRHVGFVAPVSVRPRVDAAHAERRGPLGDGANRALRRFLRGFGYLVVLFARMTIADACWLTSCFKAGHGLTGKRHAPCSRLVVLPHAKGTYQRGRSSIGRARALQARGCRFEPDRLHSCRVAPVGADQLGLEPLQDRQPGLNGRAYHAAIRPQYSPTNGHRPRRNQLQGRQPHRDGKHQHPGNLGRPRQAVHLAIPQAVTN